MNRCSQITFDFKSISDYLSKRLQMVLNTDMIKQPTARIVQQVCTNFLRAALDVGESQLTILPFGVDLQIDMDLETHRGSVPIIIVYQSLKAVLKDITNSQLDLTMCDLVCPANDPKRIKIIFSFFVDFLKLVDVMRPQFVSVIEEFTDKKDEVEEYEALLQAAEERKKTLTDQQSTRKRRELDLFNSLKSKQDELIQVVTGYENSNRLAAEFDSKTNANSEEMKRIDLEATNAQKTIDHISVELLSSPKRVRNDTEKQRQELIDIDKYAETIKEDLRKREKALEICAKAGKQIECLMERSKLLKTEKALVRENLEKVAEKTNCLNSLNQEHNYVVNQLKMNNKLKSESLENHQQMKENNAKRVEELEHRLLDIKTEIETLKNSNPSTSDSQAKMEKILSLRNAKSEVQRKSAQQIQERIEKLKSMEKNFEADQLASIENRQLVERMTDRLKSLGCDNI